MGNRTTIFVNALCIIALAVGLAGCGGGGSSHESGMSGVVINEVVGGAPGNSPRDYPGSDATVTVRALTGGPEIAHQSTDKDGRFQIDLPPGTYQVTAARTDDPYFNVEQSVIVASGTYAQVTLKIVQAVP